MFKIFNSVIEYYEAIKMDISKKFLMAQKRFYNDIMSGGVREQNWKYNVTSIEIECESDSEKGRMENAQ